ncbi:MAG TPA: polymer-forming cytoskeletal protein [Cyclobacteriaceae bacterium]|nr:polymer-forming cytoskeletal protein [Cyclobacteriaceae bacterium]
MWNKEKRTEAEAITADAISVFAAGLKIEGDVEATNDLRIDGTVLGSIAANRKVLVGGTGKVEGNIYAREVYIMGEVRGDLQVFGLAKIGSSGRVRGAITSAEIQIEPGADVEGTLKKMSLENRPIDDSFGTKSFTQLHKSS